MDTGFDSEKAPETWKTIPRRPTSCTNVKACLVHIYPTAIGMGTRYTLGTTPLVMGRQDGCDIRIDDHAVSRHHLRIQSESDGYYAVDLNSTNGTFVNDEPVSMAKLNDGDYLRIGKYIYRFLAGGNIEADYHEEIYRLTIIDALTGIHNKRYLVEFLDRELARSARYQRPLAVVLFDLDGFKAINDKLGHLAGDWILRELVQRVKTVVRKEELFARYGGEEFAVVLPETPLEGATQLAERLRLLVAREPFRFEDQDCHLTISLGVISTLGDKSLAPEELIRQVDEKLYQAKNAGRNCVFA